MDKLPSGREDYVRKVLEAYRNTPGTTGHLRRPDRLLAGELYQRCIPLNKVENALVLAAVRRMIRYAFARIARQHVGFPEDQIVSAADALSILTAVPRPVIFVDDFAGTGNQFVNTWERLIRAATGAETSFSAIAGIRGMKFFYCPVLCTQKAFDEINLMCPTVILQPAHVLTDRYSAVSPNSAIWPSHLKPTALDFLRTASSRAGIPDTDGASPDDWQGYEKQGLVLALHETIPDSTLCMLRWNKNSWSPLMVKA